MAGSVHAYIDHLKELYQVATDDALAERLGSGSKAAIANWRRRGSIPASVQLKVSKEFGGQHNIWLVEQGLTEGLLTSSVFAVLVGIYERKKADYSFPDEVQTLEWWGIVLSEAEAVVRRHIVDQLAAVPAGVQLVARCLSDVEAGRIDGLDAALHPHRLRK